jgi:hypothetical protein
VLLPLPGAASPVDKQLPGSFVLNTSRDFFYLKRKMNSKMAMNKFTVVKNEKVPISPLFFAKTESTLAQCFIHYW